VVSCRRDATPRHPRPGSHACPLRRRSPRDLDRVAGGGRAAPREAGRQREELERYAEREKDSKELEDFEGGRISETAIIVILLLLVIIIILV
jgi:hypothetical protein